MAFALVTGQTAQNEVAAGATVTATLPNNPTTGNLVVALISCGAASTTMTVVDGAATPNSYTATTKTPFSSTSSPPGTTGIFYFIATATANKAIKVTTNNTTQTDIFVAEFSGNASSSVLEADATNNTTTAGTTINLPSITTVNNGDLLVSCQVTGGNTTGANSPWTGWAGGVPASGDYAEYFIQSTAGARAVNYTTTSGAWNCIEAAFKAAAGAAGPIGHGISVLQAVKRASYW